MKLFDPDRSPSNAIEKIQYQEDAYLKLQMLWSLLPPQEPDKSYLFSMSVLETIIEDIYRFKFPNDRYCNKATNKEVLSQNNINVYNQVWETLKEESYIISRNSL